MTTTVTTKKTQTGGEIDAYCTKCKMDLNHRVVAMVGETVKRVECLTCSGQHNYRRTAAERAKEGQSALAKGTKATKTPRAKKTTAASRSPRIQWEQAITGQPTNAFKGYVTSSRFGEGELIRHKRFGDGVVTRVIDPQKVEVLFEDGPRTMAQGLSA